MIERAWSLLELATRQRKHPFHTAVLATIGPEGPEARSVILRHADPQGWGLGCHMDIRSPKAQEIRADDRISWLFYSFPDKLQVRARGRGVLHHKDAVAEEKWQESQLLSRRCYLAPYAPSVVTATAETNIPEPLIDREPTKEEASDGIENFAVLRCDVEVIDVLSLEFNGNLRLRGTPAGNREWLAP